MQKDRTMLCLGLAIALTAAALLFFDVIDSGPAAVVGIIGIGLIATSGTMFSAHAVLKGKK